MPLGVYVPSQLNDLAVDVAVGTPAQGALLYRGGAKWNSLAAGASGRFLKTQGAGADPIWADLPAADLSPSVILAPATSARNTVQPTANAVVPVTFKQFGSSTAHLWDGRDSSANLMAYLEPTGQLQCDVALNTTPSTTKLLDVTGGSSSIGRFAGLRLFADGDMNVTSHFGSSLLRVRASDGTVIFAQFQAGGGLFSGQVSSTVFNGNAQGAHFMTVNDVGMGFRVYRGAGMEADLGLVVDALASQTGLLQVFRGISSGPNTRHMAAIDANWVSSTDASRKAYFEISAYDTAIRKVIRGEADGTNPMVGFLGGGAVVKQAGASAAGIAAITDANAKAAIGALQNALAAYSLVTAPA